MEALGGTENEIGVVFNNNVYYNIPPHPGDKNAKTSDPRFIDPGKAGTEIDLNTMKELSGYRLSKDSPYLDGATPIPNNGGQNILGGRLPEGKQRYGAL